MPTSLKILAFLLSAHVIGGCASLKRARQAREIRAAHATLQRYQQDLPPVQQLADLLAANPALEGQRVRVVRMVDTVRIAEVHTEATLPAVSTQAGDNALVDSLMRVVGSQMHALDSTLFAARLRAELAARPRLSRDTVTRAVGPITLRLWTDVRGRPQVRVVKARQAIAFDQEVHEMKAPPLPKPDIGFLPRIWLFIKDASTLVVLLIVGGVVWFIIGFIRRNRPQV